MENFNLRKFLVENKLTTNSRLIKESSNPTINKIKQLLAGQLGVDLSATEEDRLNSLLDKVSREGESSLDKSEREWLDSYVTRDTNHKNLASTSLSGDEVYELLQEYSDDDIISYLREKGVNEDAVNLAEELDEDRWENETPFTSIVDEVEEETGVRILNQSRPDITVAISNEVSGRDAEMGLSEEDVEEYIAFYDQKDGNYFFQFNSEDVPYADIMSKLNFKAFTKKAGLI